MTSYVQEIHMASRKPLSASKKKEAEDALNAKFAEESKLVKGIFKNIEAPGAGVEFPFKKFPQDPIRIYKFEDGQTYEIPLAVARHINTVCQEKKHSWIVDANGNKTVDQSKTRQRYQFLSTDYM